MKSYSLNSDNDIYLDGGRFVLIEDGAQVAAKLRTNLLTYLGEWFLDLNTGVPYFQEIFVKPVDLANVESILKQTILTTDGVESLTTFETSFDGVLRSFAVQAQVKTIYNTVEEIQVNV